MMVCNEARISAPHFCQRAKNVSVLLNILTNQRPTELEKLQLPFQIS